MNSAIKIFIDYRQFQIFILGIFSGIPLTIIYSTLATWMKQMGIDIAVITTFAIARVFYSLKFLWAPFIDRIDLPILSKI
ncbi:MAG: MFS transporter, partial [Rickettsiaceae bacterium]|nr:MFS transporter [Rickettsiaceae bacterium]